VASDDAPSNERRTSGSARRGLRSWRTKDVGARTLGREAVRPRGAGRRRGDGRRGEEARRDGHPLPRQGDREAARGRAGAGPERRLVWGRPVVVALAGPVRIHRAEARRVGALMVRGGLLDLLDDRLERERLQAHHEGEQERKHLRCSRSKWRRGRHRHGIASIVIRDSARTRHSGGRLQSRQKVFRNPARPTWRLALVLVGPVSAARERIDGGPSSGQSLRFCNGRR
jgi:hypothetical protein